MTPCTPGPEAIEMVGTTRQRKCCKEVLMIQEQSDDRVLRAVWSGRYFLNTAAWALVLVRRQLGAFLILIILSLLPSHF